MTPLWARVAIALMLGLTISLASAAPKGKEEPKGKESGKPGGGGSAERKSEPNSRGTPSNSERDRGTSSAPGGNWSNPTHQFGRGPSSAESALGQSSLSRDAASTTVPGGAAAGEAASRRGPTQLPGTQATGTQDPGARDAAAGAAAANRNEPNLSGTQGAAAGAAVTHRNEPQYSGAQGAAAGAAVADRNQAQLPGLAGAVPGTAAVRNSYNNRSLYGGQWYAAHPEAFAPAGWTAATAWAPTNWNAFAAFSGAAAAPVAYNYGTNVTYQDGYVAVAGQNVGTADEFSQQAADLAQSGAAADVSATTDWMSLGVFAMVRNEQQHPQLILQLAINKQGILRGNFTDELTEVTQSIQGAADLTTQRAAWTVGSNQTTVMEAGLSNLTQGEAPALIHKNGQTDHWLLVRLEQPPVDATGR